MPVVTQFEPQCYATRIAVDSVLLYRSEEMEDFELCRVTSVSTSELEILLKQPLAERTVVNIAVRDEASRRQFYRVIGEVSRCVYDGSEWVHGITASPRRPWSSKFLYDVVCSTPDSAPTVAERYRVARGAGLESRHRSPSDALRDIGWNVIQFPSSRIRQEFSLY